MLFQNSHYGNHHWFYSKRAIYLLVFSLQDGESGVQELDLWLMNINVSIVVVVYYCYCVLYS